MKVKDFESKEYFICEKLGYTKDGEMLVAPEQCLDDFGICTGYCLIKGYESKEGKCICD